MSDAMYAAIRRRKMQGGMKPEAAPQAPQAPAPVESPSNDAQNISKGHASPTEKTKIEERAQQEMQTQPMDAAPADESYDSDEIAKDMLDSRFRQGVPEGLQPRNLSERMKMNVATKLKEKGKL